MQDEKWRETLGRIKDTFDVLAHEQIHGDAVSGEVEFIEFVTPGGKMKLERTSKPRVIGKTAIGSKRIGSTATVQYQYSDTEKIHIFKAYRWDERLQAWTEIDIQRGGFST